jgi:hypothetical protein
MSSRVTRSESVERRVTSRVEAGKCLGKHFASRRSTELVDCCSVAKARGLCATCLDAFYADLKSQTTPEAFELARIRDGLVLAPNEVREIRAKSKNKKRKPRTPRAGCAATIDQGGSVVDFLQEVE